MKINDLKNQIDNEEIAATIISCVLDCSKSQIFTLTEISDKAAHKCLKIAKNYASGIPIAYQTDKWHFYGIPLYVNKNVLIPRLDTEILANTVIEFLNKSDKQKSVLDLCTGSGCISMAVLHHKKDKISKITVSDISRKALTVAKKNLKSLCEVEFIRGYMFKKIKTRYDIIICNPPYIKTGEIGKHDSTITHEPCIALDGGGDGLYFYKLVSKEAAGYLNEEGMLFLEIGHDQEEDVKILLQENQFSNIGIIKDLQGLSRVITAVRRNYDK